MALRKPTPAFEGQEPATSTEMPADLPPINTAAETVAPVETAAANETPIRPTPVPPAEAAVPAVAAKNVPAVAKKFTPALEEYKGVIDPSTMDFDTFTRITVGLDGFTDDQDVPLGKIIKIQLMSWNERYTVTAGEDNAEANEKVRFSLDGKTIDGTGESVTEYLKVLREVDGYENASVKKYYALYGFLMQTSAPDARGYPNVVDVDPVDRAIVSIQIPPRSVSLFTRYQITTGVKISQGIIEASDELVLTQGKQAGKTKDYANIQFSRN